MTEKSRTGNFWYMNIKHLCSYRPSLAWPCMCIFLGGKIAYFPANACCIWMYASRKQSRASTFESKNVCENTHACIAYQDYIPLGPFGINSVFWIVLQKKSYSFNHTEKAKQNWIYPEEKQLFCHSQIGVVYTAATRCAKHKKGSHP